MSVLIKYCGLRSSADIQAATQHGGRFVGMVHHASSPRHLPVAAMAQLAAQVPAHIAHVAVMVNPDNELLQQLTNNYRPNFLQIHGASPARLAAINGAFNIPLIAAIGVASSADLTDVDSYQQIAAHLLFDAKQAGSGQAFDWNILRSIKPIKPWFLAGGLNADNVAAAIAATGAPMVDVSSGIESAPGIKSAEKIAAFHAAVLNA